MLVPGLLSKIFALSRKFYEGENKDKIRQKLRKTSRIDPFSRFVWPLMVFNLILPFGNPSSAMNHGDGADLAELLRFMNKEI